MSKIIEVKKLSKSYGPTPAVHDISFDVEDGEIFALIGPNGAGKSTTLRTLATILTPTSGTVTIGGFDLHRQPNRIRDIISYLPEEAGAYKNLRGLDYLKFMAALHFDDVAARAEAVDHATEIAGLGPRLKDKVSTYSKGMARKLLLARTVMTKPKLAILDEPTSGLDVINAIEIRDTIKKLAAEGMAVLLSSHNMLEIEYLSHSVGIINKGKLLEVGTPKSLKTKYHASNLEEVFVRMVA